MSEHGKGGLDQSGFHYDNCAGSPCNCDEKRYGNSGGGLSGFSVVLLEIGGFLFMAAVVIIFDWDIDAIPGVVYLILWGICTAVVGWGIAVIKALL